MIGKDPEGGRIPVGWTQCKSTDKCGNNKCFFRMRDQFGWPVWCYSGSEIEAKKAVEKAGIDMEDIIFPKLSVNIGTNVIYLFCEDKI